MFDQITKALGIISSYNPLTTASGGLIRANDCVCRRENVYEDRRGYQKDGTLANTITQMLSYQGKVLVSNGSIMSVGPSSYISYAGTYVGPSGLKIRSAEAASNLYFTTSLGIKVFTDVAGTTARSAGLPRMLDPNGALNSGLTGFLAGSAQVAYRCTLIRTDANKNVITGYPSQRFWILNSVFTATGITSNTVTTTVTTTSGSNLLSNVTSFTGISVGQTVTGTGIPASTTVTAVSSSAISISNNATAPGTLISVTFAGAGTPNQITSVSSTTGLVVGQSVTGAGIPLGSQITAIAGSTVTISTNATATASGVALSFFAAHNIDLSIYLPAEAIAGDIVKIFRTAQVTGLTTDSAGDECALIYQYTLASADISAGLISFTDLTVDALRGESLYTNASQQGIYQANERPPVSTDLALYKTFMLYANCQTKQRLFFTIVGVTGLTGKTLTIAGTVYNFGATEIISGAGSPQVKIGSTGVTAADIDSTARSLIRVINRYAGNTAVYAYYQSGPSDLPGQIQLEERGIGASAFGYAAGDGTIVSLFSPQAPISPATSTNTTSSNQIQANAVYYSKDSQFEHVPSLNYVLVGASNKKILRVIPLRNSAIIIKEEGIYRITGEQPQNFTVTPLDLTVFCKSRDSIASLANQVFMLSNQGVVSISENGVQVISRVIANLVTPLLQNPNLATLTSGAGYESEGWYLLSTITNSTDSTPNQTLVYSIYTKTWVRWTYAFAAALVEPISDRLYFAKPNSTIVYAERKSFTDSDYADPELTITIASIANNKVTISSATAPLIGWAIAQNGTTIPISKVITNNTNPVTYTLSLLNNPPGTWISGAALMYPAVGMDIEYLPWTHDNAGSMKQVRIFKILVDTIGGSSSETSLIATFHSNFDDAVESVVLSNPGSGWGSSWGSIPWGGGGASYGYPTYVPRNKQYCTRLMVGIQHPNALERVSVLGCAFEFEDVSGVIGR